MHELEPIDSGTAVELYLDDRRTDTSQATLYAHSSRLGHFTRWCGLEEIDNLNDLTRRDLQRYRIWRREDGDLAPASLKTQMDTLRVFIRWGENIGTVAPDTHLAVRSPTLQRGEHARDEKLDPEDATAALRRLARFEYASARHVTLHLAWHTAARRGALRALDVEDYHPDDEYLKVRHRPDTDTPLKNGRRGERLVALSADTCELLDAWIAERRPDVVDEHGRRPLLATKHGRVHVQTVQKWIYATTRPCEWEDCPHGKHPEDCEAAVNTNCASGCPSSLGPHAVRRGAITHWLTQDVPGPVVSDRANVSADVLDEHYDRRTEREKMEQRRRFLDNL